MNALGERFQRLAAEARLRVRELGPAEVAGALANGALVVDVRSRAEFVRQRLRGASHFGRGGIEQQIEFVAPDLDTPVVCYCQRGDQAALTAETLQRMGYARVAILAGGLRAWIQAGFPTVRTEEAID